MLQLTPEEKLRRVRAALAMLVGSTVRAVQDKFGEEGVKVITDAWLKDHVAAVPSLMKMVDAQENSLDVFASIVDFTDDFYGIEGYWTERTPQRAVKVETLCPVSKFWSAATCEKIFCSAMEGMGRGITGSQGFRAKVRRFTDDPEKACEVTYEIVEEDLEGKVG